VDTCGAHAHVHRHTYMEGGHLWRAHAHAHAQVGLTLTAVLPKGSVGQDGGMRTAQAALWLRASALLTL